MKQAYRTIIIFLIAFAANSFFISWHGFADPDAFYHAKISELLWQNGPLQQFPWLDLTTFGQKFADLHFGFHVLTAPFVGIFGKFLGLRLVCVILASCLITAFYLCLKNLKIRYAEFWTFLLFCTQPFLVRILLGKASPLAIMIFLIGLTAALLRKPWLLAFSGFCFALSHGGWIYLAGSVILIQFGNILYDRIVLSRTWHESIKNSFWLGSILIFSGSLLGWVIHPNFPNTFWLGWTQVVSIGLGTPYRLLLGSEWLPSDLIGFLVSFAPWIIVILLGLAGFLLAPNKSSEHKNMRLVASIGWVVAVLVALTFKSRRNVEYLAPVIAMWAATIWMLVDVRRYFEIIKKAIPYQRSIMFFITLLFSVLMIRELTSVWNVFHPVNFLDDVYMESTKAISEYAKPGDRIFHTNWDEFPMLFAAHEELRFISGLDPTFFHTASPYLSDRVRELTWIKTTSTREEAWSLIHDELKCRFIFIKKKNHEKFLELIRSDERYLPLADAKDSAAFILEQ